LNPSRPAASSPSPATRRVGQWLTLAMHLAAAAVFVSISLVPAWWSNATIDFVLFQFFLFEFVGALASLAAGKAWYVTRPGAWLRVAVIVAFAGFLLGTWWNLAADAQRSTLMLALIGTIGSRVIDWSFRLRASKLEGAQILISGAVAFVLWMVLTSWAMGIVDDPVEASASTKRTVALMIAAYFVLLGAIQFVVQGRFGRSAIAREVSH
jgi:hypothetical protein